MCNSTEEMCAIAADYYEEFFKQQNVTRPHLYTDSPLSVFDHEDEKTPQVTLEELLLTVQMKKKKKSVDAHGLSNFMFNYIAASNWSSLLSLYNLSFHEPILPIAWEGTRIIPLAKKESICPPSSTHPISLIDIFQKQAKNVS